MHVVIYTLKGDHYTNTRCHEQSIVDFELSALYDLAVQVGAIAAMKWEYHQHIHVTAVAAGMLNFD